MKRVRRDVACWVAVCCAFVYAGAARAQVLRQVPSDALVVIKVNNLQQTNEKFIAFAKRIGIDLIDEAWANPLGSLQKFSNMNNGVNLKGELAMVVVNPQQAQGEPILLLVPVTDFKAFVGNFPDARTEDGLTVVKMPNDDEDSYVAQWGDYAALTPTRGLLGKKPEGVTAEGLAAKELDAKDLVVWANMKAIRETVKPMLKDGRQQAMAELEREMGEQNKKWSPAVKALVGQAMTAAEGFLEDASGVTFGVSVGREGINTTLLAEFKPDSYAAKTVKNVKGGEGNLLAGLPEGKYVLFGGMSNDSGAMSKLIDDFIDPVVKELVGVGEDGKAIANYMDAMRASLKSTKSMSMGMVVPAGKLGQESLFQTIAVYRGDAKALVEMQRKTPEYMDALMNLIPGAAQQMKFNFEKDAAKVDGVSFDRMTGKINIEDPQAQQMAAMMYGPGGMQVLSGALDDKRFLLASGVPDALLTKLIASAKADADAMGKLEHVGLVANQLPKTRVAEFYFGLDNFVSMVMNTVSQMGFPVPKLQLPPNLPPIGMSVATEGTAVRIDSVTPSQLLEAVVAGYKKLQLDQRGPRGGGL